MSKEIHTLIEAARQARAAESLATKRGRQYEALGAEAIKTDDIARIDRIGHIMDRTLLRQASLTEKTTAHQTTIAIEKPVYDTHLADLRELAPRHPTLASKLKEEETLYHTFLELIQPEPTEPISPAQPEPEVAPEPQVEPTTETIHFQDGLIIDLPKGTSSATLALLADGEKTTQELAVIYNDHESNPKKAHDRVYANIQQLRKVLPPYGRTVIRTGERGNARYHVEEIKDAKRPSIHDAAVITTALRDPKILAEFERHGIPSLSLEIVEKIQAELDKATKPTILTRERKTKIFEVFESLCKDKDFLIRIPEKSINPVDALLRYFRDLGENRHAAIDLLWKRLKNPEGWFVQVDPEGFVNGIIPDTADIPEKPKAPTIVEKPARLGEEKLVRPVAAAQPVRPVARTIPAAAPKSASRPSPVRASAPVRPVEKPLVPVLTPEEIYRGKFPKIFTIEPLALREIQNATDAVLEISGPNTILADSMRRAEANRQLKQLGLDSVKERKGEMSSDEAIALTLGQLVTTNSLFSNEYLDPETRGALYAFVSDVVTKRLSRLRKPR